MCEYRDSFQTADIEGVATMLGEVDITGIDQNGMDVLCQSLSDIFITPAWSLGMVVEKRHSNNRKRKPAGSVNQPWFSKECEQRRSEYIKFKNKWCKIKTDEAAELRKKEAKKYRNFIRKTRRITIRTCMVI